MYDSYVPACGDLVWLRFDPQAGHEQAGRRPAFVLSPRAYNERVGLALCCPITSRVKGYPFEVSLPDACSVQGCILSDQVKSLDWRAREAEFIETAADSLILEVRMRVLALVDPDR